jgi:preprotein translocase subunit YajC
VNYLPLIIVVAVLFVAMTLTKRNRARSLEREAEQREQIGFGTEVMTTSGLYGTVVGMNDDDSVQLAIAPGVQVKWALAALRDVSSLPASYRPANANSDEPPADQTGT